MTKKEILIPMLQELIDTNFRVGFEDTVLQRCRSALFHAGMDDEAVQMWNDACCGRKAEAFDNDRELMDKYTEANQESLKTGAFEMPHWGTYGT